MSEATSREVMEACAAWARNQKANNANPEKTYHYTPFGIDVDVVKKNGKLFGIGNWECGFWGKVFGLRCKFDLAEDPACDSCLRCGQPEERF